MKRPKTHLIEERSERALYNLLPVEWTCQKIIKDYGYDYFVSIFKDEKQANRFFTVQLKGTEKVSRNGIIKCVVKRENLEDYEESNLPVLLLCYSVNENKFWGKIVNEYLKKERIPQERVNVTIEFDDSELIDKNILVKNYIHLFKSFGSISILLKSDEESNVYIDKLRIVIERYLKDMAVIDIAGIANYASVEFYTENNNIHCIIINKSKELLNEIIFNKNKITNNLKYLSEHYAEIPEEFSQVLWELMKLNLSQFNDSQMELMRYLLLKLSIDFKDTEIIELSKVLSNDRNVQSFQQIVKELLKNGNVHIACLLNYAYFYDVNNKTKNDFYGENLKTISETNMIINDRDKGTSCYNYANYLRTKGEQGDALHYYVCAKRYYGEYLKQGYWWREVGNTLFLLNKYACAESCFRKSFSLTSNNLDRLYLADSLFYQCKFNEAIKIYQKIDYKILPKKLLSDGMLKELVGKVIIDYLFNQKLKVETFSREKKESEKLLDDLMINNLSSISWFNLGVCANINKKYEIALNAFTTAAVLLPQDQESWLNALLLSLRMRKIEYMSCILMRMVCIYGDDVKKIILERIAGGSLLEVDEKKIIEMFHLLCSKIDEMD